MARKKIKKSGETPAPAGLTGATGRSGPTGATGPTGPTGPSREYRELLNGEITADEYVKKLKEEVDEFLERERGE